jgi:hypothetical protein
MKKLTHKQAMAKLMEMELALWEIIAQAGTMAEASMARTAIITIALKHVNIKPIPDDITF